MFCLVQYVHNNVCGTVCFVYYVMKFMFSVFFHTSIYVNFSQINFYVKTFQVIEFHRPSSISSVQSGSLSGANNINNSGKGEKREVPR